VRLQGDQGRRRAPAAALTADSGWFFDTEFLVLAERAGLRIHEVPVDWTDDPDSRVRLLATVLADLRGIVRLGAGLGRGAIRVPRLDGEPPSCRSGGLLWQLGSFAVVGAASTLAYIALYLLLRGPLGAQPANALSLLLTAIANTAANRRFTFGIRGRAHAGRDQLRGLIAFCAGLAVTSGVLAWLHAADTSPGRAAEVAVLVAANLAATAIRFALFRGWVFGRTAAR
jgi:putative flippase GtrA